MRGGLFAPPLLIVKICLPPPEIAQPKAQNSRIAYIDLAKGFCIILVAFTHIVDFYDRPYALSGFFTAFRMPLYFFLSGLFFKPYEGFIGFAKRKVNKLIIPFFFFYLTTWVLLSNALHAVGYDVRNTDALGLRSLWAFVTPEQFPNGPIWFLLCLFWVNMIFYAIQWAAKVRAHGSERYEVTAITMLSLGCGLTGYACSSAGVDLWAFTDTALTCTPFYCTGFILRKYTSILHANKSDRWLPLMVAAAAVVTWFCRGGIHFQLNDFGGANPVVILIGGVSGTLAVMFLAKMIGRLPFVSGWGRYSIIILCTHIMLIQLLFRIFERCGVNEALGAWPSIFVMLGIVMFSYEAIIPICIRLIPWFTAQRDVISVGDRKKD